MIDYHRWSLWVEQEFFQLGDVERAAGLPISPFCDRESDTNLPKNQLGFLTHVCRPLYVAVMVALEKEDTIMSASYVSGALARLDLNSKAWAAELIE